MGQLDGKVAMITGAGRGLGRATAVRLAESGARIVACDIAGPIATAPFAMASEDDLSVTKKAVEAAGGQCVTLKADVRSTPEMQRVVDAAMDTFGAVDIVVANAAFTSYSPLVDLSDESWDELIDVDLGGVWRTCKLGAKPMIEAGKGGSIHIILSVAAQRYMSNVGHYMAAKHGGVGLMRALAVELGQHMIRVNSILPSVFDQQITASVRSVNVFTPGEKFDLDRIAAKMQSMNALPVPWCEARDVANAIHFLASDEGRYITGVPLPVDLGMLLK